MNWTDSQIQEVSEKAQSQRPYGSSDALLFGLTMLSFFGLTHIAISSFVFRYVIPYEVPVVALKSGVDRYLLSYSFSALSSVVTNDQLWIIVEQSWFAIYSIHYRK